MTKAGDKGKLVWFTHIVAPYVWRLNIPRIADPAGIPERSASSGREIYE